MDLTLRAAAKTSAATGEPLTPGARLSCFLIKGVDGELERFDLLEGEEGEWTPPGPVVARWSRTLPEKEETPAEARQRAMSDAETLFRALIAPEEEEETNAPIPVEDRAALGYLLSLHLERGRQLRAAPGTPRRLVHTQTKESFNVPAVELSPADYRRFSELFAEN